MSFIASASRGIDESPLGVTHAHAAVQQEALQISLFQQLRVGPLRRRHHWGG